MSFGYTTFILLSFSRYFRNISNFVNKYSNITLCRMLVRRIPSYIMAGDGKPESISELIHRKIPCINSVALSNDTEQSIYFNTSWYQTGRNIYFYIRVKLFT